ncbi:MULTISPECIES: hypothetical protein [Lactobacillus]|uniref:hypothetical protein n=1 Tax=Lactobacillus TaxID=1578 RepID=UPI0013747C77|nr:MULTISPECIES: hypothetical protein [Lactobacillus]
MKQRRVKFPQQVTLSTIIGLDLLANPRFMNQFDSLVLKLARNIIAKRVAQLIAKENEK